MEVLILGGGSFIGKNTLHSLMKNKELRLTVLNRGKTSPHNSSKINYIKADRDDDCSAIAQQNWDLVIDFSCYFPHQLRNVIKWFKKPLTHYIFISTCSVYEIEAVNAIERDESSSILECSANQETDTSVSTYGQRKAQCERILRESQIPFTIFRPALVFGPYDPTDRLYYWLHQVKTYPSLLLPEEGKRIFSLTSVIDLVECIEKAIELGAQNKEYNTVSYPRMSILKLVQHAQELLSRQVELLSIGADLLSRKQIQQWTDMPLWLNTDSFTYSNSALKNDLGFTPTPFQLALQGSIEYHVQMQWPEPQYGMPESKRQELLAEVKRMSKSPKNAFE